MEELTTREGTVQSVIFQNEENGYTVLRLVTEEGELITVVGCVPCAAPGEHLGVSGAWETHPQHGTQLRAEEVERRLPEDAEELISYLGSGICKGLGPATARRLVERFGAETADVISSQPEKLSLIKGITARRAMEISESFRRHMGLRRLMAFLAQYGLPPVLAIRLRQIYGDGALDAIRRDPYLLSADAGGLPFSAADEIAMSMGFSARSPERLRSALLFELSHNEGNGHVFLPRPKLLAATAQLLGDEDGVEEALDTLIDEGKVFSETVANVEACYLLRLHEAEDYACRKLTNLLSATADVSSRAGKTVDEIEAAQGITYAPLQRKAVELAAEHGVLILTGGPGTGKTTTVRGIVSLFERMGLAIVLAAPTGRAAQRLGELTGREAQTVHRLLGMSWNEATHEVTFTKGEKEPLEADAVIVDEMSMVDLPLFAALLRALRPGTRLVMVGDADQLPSVGPGNVFSDLIRSGKVETVFLREVFRQAERSAIIRNAHAVNAGEPPRLQNDQGDFYFLCRRDGEPQPPPAGGPEPPKARPAGGPLGGAHLPPRRPGDADPERLRHPLGEGGRHRGQRRLQRRRGPHPGHRPGGGVAGHPLRGPEGPLLPRDALGDRSRLRPDGPQGPGQRVPLCGPLRHALRPGTHGPGRALHRPDESPGASHPGGGRRRRPGDGGQRPPGPALLGPPLAAGPLWRAQLTKITGKESTQ